MIDEYSVLFISWNKRLYSPQLPVRFVQFLASPSEETYFLMIPRFMFIIFCLLFLYFLKFISAAVIGPGVSYGTWNSPSISFFANKYDCAINSEQQEKTTRL